MDETGKIPKKQINQFYTDFFNVNFSPSEKIILDKIFSPLLIEIIKGLSFQDLSPDHVLTFNAIQRMGIIFQENISKIERTQQNAPEIRRISHEFGKGVIYKIDELDLSPANKVYILNASLESVIKTEEIKDTDSNYYADIKRILTRLIEKNKNKINDTPEKELILEWSSKFDLKYLETISRDLKIKGFTKLPTDFKKVFTEQRKIIWLKEPEYLAYLIFSLYNKFNTIKAYKKGYFKAATVYFSDCIDTVGKKFKENELKELCYNITKRNAPKYLELRGRVDKFLKGILPEK